MTASGAHLAMRETGAASVSRSWVVVVIPAASGLPLQEGQGGRVHRASTTRSAPLRPGTGLSRQAPVGGALIAAARNVIAQRRAASPATGERLGGAGRVE